MNIKEAIMKTSTINEAIKLIEEDTFNELISEKWVIEKTGKIYDKLLFPNKWLVKA